MNSRSLPIWSLFVALAVAVSARAQLIDTQPPTVQIRLPGSVAKIPGGTNTVEVSGTAKDNGAVVKVEVKLDGVTSRIATLTGSNARYVSWKVAFSMTEGLHTVEVIATDDFGLTGSRTRDFRVLKVCQIAVAVDPLDKGSVNRPSAAVQVGSVPSYTARLKRGTGYMFDHWELDGSPIGTSPTVTFTVPDVAAKTLTAKFSPNPYVSLAGIYNDRLENAGGSGEGFYTLTLTTEGTFTLFASASGASIRAKGSIDFSGIATVTKSGSNPVTVAVQAYLLGGGGLRLDFLRNVLATHFTADTTLYPATAAPIPSRGTAVLAPGAGLPVELQGSGFATLSRGSNGRYRLKGKLADGTAWSAAVFATAEGGAAFPIFKKLPNGTALDGKFIWDVGADAISGQIAWQRSEKPRAPFSPPLNGSLSVHGKSFIRPARGQFVAPLGPAATGSIATLTGGVANVSANFNFTARHIAAFGAVNPASFALKLSPATGLYSGKWTDTATGGKLKFAGVLVQKIIPDAGGDYALGEGYSIRPGAIDRSELKLFTSP